MSKYPVYQSSPGISKTSLHIHVYIFWYKWPNTNIPELHKVANVLLQLLYIDLCNNLESNSIIILYLVIAQVKPIDYAVDLIKYLLFFG